jgi:hypothetical protein
MHGQQNIKIPNSCIKKYFKNNVLESLNALASDPEGSTLLTVKFAIAAQDPEPPPSTLFLHNLPPYKSDFLSPSSGKRPLLSPLLHQNSASMFVFTTPATCADYHNLNFTDLPILGDQYKSWHS